MNNHKMSTRQLCKKVIPALLMTACLTTTITVGMLNNTSVLNTTFGNGSVSVSTSSHAIQNGAQYYPQLYKTSAEARNAAFSIAEQISDEGIVLLKNNGILPLDRNTAITPLGLRYWSAYYGGTGSSATGTGDSYGITPSEGLHSVFPRVNTVLEDYIAKKLESDSSDLIRISKPVSGNSEKVEKAEFDPDIYLPVESSMDSTVGIVYIGRRTGEGTDASVWEYDDGSRHMLALSQAELETIAYAKKHCANVIVVLASSAPMEIACLEDDRDISAILWVGGAGSSGYASLGRILVGDVVPSGHLPDTWVSNFKSDPTFANQDNGTDQFVYRNAFTTLANSSQWLENAPAPFREYEEGIYFGYRYYETAFELGALEDYNDRAEGVLYSFGHGLSYTTFRQELLSCVPEDNAVHISVRVTNTGTCFSGKDVIQIYVSPPYTSLDEQYGIEKAAVNLVAFQKTDLLGPGEQQIVHLSIPMDDLASYCYTHPNLDGSIGCYCLEAGEYLFSIRRNSHDIIAQQSIRQSHTIWYEGLHTRLSEKEAQSGLNHIGKPDISPVIAYQAATNQFPELTEYMTSPQISHALILSRSDWDNTQPTPPNSSDQTASEPVISWIKEADSTSAEAQIQEPLTSSGVISACGPITLADLRGKDYSDIMWDQLMLQLDFDDPKEIYNCLFDAGYHTHRLSEIGKPESAEYDGIQGLTLADTMGNNYIRNVCAYPSAPIMAATWNADLMYELGYMVGQEALTAGINGWYAPALNLHRSPFCGRVSEYFSEDPLLAGKIGAQIISGGSDAGICCVVKHFPLMESETHKNPHTTVWMTEQALREIYLRPYEIALNESRKTIAYLDEESGLMKTTVMRSGCMVMVSDSAVGPCWSATNYSLLSNVLRKEWGFEGAVITDMHLLTNASQIENILEAGCDMMMSTTTNGSQSAQKILTSEDYPRIQTAVKNLCYCLVNSNLMQGISPGTHVEYHLPIWKTILFTIDCLVGIGILGILIGLWIRYLREKSSRAGTQQRS